MPYKFDTDKLRVGKARDQRYKLTDEQRAEIRRLYGKVPQRELAKMFHVSRSLIRFVGDPQKYEKDKKRRRQAHYYKKEKARAYIKKHREYKKKLFGLVREPRI